MLKIILGDIDTSMSNVICDSLGWYGLKIQSVQKPRDIIPSLMNNKYDLFICNSWMGFIDGYSLCGVVRDTIHPNLNDLEILLLTHEIPGYEEFQFLSEKNIYYMMKYKSPDKLYAKIMAIINKSVFS